MNGWYHTKNKLDGSNIVINLDTVNVITADLDGSAVFFMSRPNLTVHSAEKYDDVIQKIFCEKDEEEGEDDGEPGDPSGFGGMLPM